MNPVLHRHLRSSVLRNRFFWLLSLYLLGFSILTLLFNSMFFVAPFLQSDSNLSMSGIYEQGQILYRSSSLLLLVVSIILAPVGALGSVSSEQEHRTLDLLRVTTLRPRTLVLGKFLAVLASGTLYLLSPLPLLIVGAWLGSISATEMILTAGFLLTTLLFSTAQALFISSLVRKTVAAVLLYYGLIVATLPIAAILAFVLGALPSYLIYTEGLPPLPFWVVALLQHGWVLITGLHPISAAITTVALSIDQGSWLLVEFYVNPTSLGTGSIASGGTIILPSPWIPFTLLALAGTALLLWLTARRLGRPER